MKMVMIPTVLMVAYLATNILSKTYLVETVSKDHGYGVLRQHSGSDYGNDYEAGGRQRCEQIRDQLAQCTAAASTQTSPSWTQWTSWSFDKTCGDSKKYRKRECLDRNGKPVGITKVGGESIGGCMTRAGIPKESDMQVINFIGAKECEFYHRH